MSFANEHAQSVDIQGSYSPVSATSPFIPPDSPPLRKHLRDDALDMSIEQDAEPIEFFKTQTAGMLSSFLNMANSIIGAGIIGLAYALREAGFWSGVFLLMALTWLVDWTLVLLVKTGRITSSTSYQSLVESTFGRRGLYIISFFQFCMAFGGMCAYNVIIGDTIPPVLRALFGIDPNGSGVLHALTSRRFIIFLCTAGISYPLSLYRDIAKLAKASAMALLAIVVIVLAVLVEAPRVDVAFRGSPASRWTFLESGIFQSIGVISFAFVCHHNTFIIINALRKPTLDRAALVTHLSTFFSMLASMLLAITGFMVFTDKTQGNILNNFPNDNVFISIARLCFGLNMFTTFPLEHFVAREVVEELLWPFPRKPPKWSHIVITTTLVSISLIISLATCDLGLVLELAGGSSAVTLAYILPPACYLKATEGKGRTWWDKRRRGKWACIAFGVIVMVVSTVTAISKAVTGSGKHAQCNW